jgi:predicted GNAT family acetyltransferase
MTMADVEVSDNPGRHRYEAHLDGALAGFAQYRDRPGRRIFTHTEVDAAFEGHGVGGALASAALDDVRRMGLAVVPQCPFIAAYIDKHPDYADLVYQGD